MLRNRLRKLEFELGLSPQKMARIGNCSRSTYYRYRNGTSVPDVEFIGKILNYEKSLNPGWLLTGRGDMTFNSDDSNQPHDFDDQAAHTRLHHLPFYQMKSLNYGESKIPSDDWNSPAEFLPICDTFIRSLMDADHPDSIFAIQIECDTMEPEVKRGSIVLADAKENNPATDGIFLIRLDNFIRIKLLQPLPGKRLQLSTINKKYDPIDVDIEYQHFEVLGRAIWCGSFIF